jgi:hypothetical protein
VRGCVNICTVSDFGTARGVVKFTMFSVRVTKVTVASGSGLFRESVKGPSNFARTFRICQLQDFIATNKQGLALPFC